jgi:hypothetical protein
MSTLASKTPVTIAIQATGVRFTDIMVYVVLNDGREIGLPLSLRDLRWLARATPEQRASWAIGPGGRYILWDDLDDGIEVEHLLKDYSLS